jgi:hypothetical protein
MIPDRYEEVPVRTIQKLCVPVTCVIASVSPARTQGSPDCLVPGIQDFRAVPAHLNQADILGSPIFIPPAFAP